MVNIEYFDVQPRAGTNVDTYYWTAKINWSVPGVWFLDIYFDSTKVYHTEGSAMPWEFSKEISGAVLLQKPGNYKFVLTAQDRLFAVIEEDRKEVSVVVYEAQAPVPGQTIVKPQAPAPSIPGWAWGVVIVVGGIAFLYFLPEIKAGLKKLKRS